MSKPLTSLQAKTNNLIKLSTLVTANTSSTVSAYGSMCNVIHDKRQCAYIACRNCIFHFPLGANAVNLNTIMEKIV